MITLSMPSTNLFWDRPGEDKFTEGYSFEVYLLDRFDKPLRSRGPNKR